VTRDERRILEEKDRLFQENKVLRKAMDMMVMVADCDKCDITKCLLKGEEHESKTEVCVARHMIKARRTLRKGGLRDED
jgi:hypothetical protein